MNNKNFSRKIASIIYVLIGIIIGFSIGAFYIDRLSTGELFNLDKTVDISRPQMLMLYALFIIIFAFIGFAAENFFFKLKEGIVNMNNADKINLILSFVLGLILTSCLSPALGIPLNIPERVVIALVLIGLCYQALKSITEQFSGKSGSRNYTGKVKFLDTNVIIDGRIADLYKTGFVEGDIVVPKFILLELQIISDSSDSLKRARGRRGLEILNNMQEEMDLKIKDTPYDGLRMEIDTKLMKYAKENDAVIITNDYNLNKVATLQNIGVLNINELAEALKPIVLPGEQMKIAIMKEGKEKEQGIAYLDDGTMIVVENARHLVGEIKNIEVTSVLQSVQGKMIFARILEDMYAPKKKKNTK